MNKFAKIIGAAMVVLMPLGAMAQGTAPASPATSSSTKAKKSDTHKAKSSKTHKKTKKAAPAQ
jgi:hypothetical protein